MTPIIIPAQVPRNCIIEAGIRYCESQPIAPRDVGIISFFIIAIILWALLIGYALVEKDRPGIAILIVLAPFLYGLTYLL